MSIIQRNRENLLLQFYRFSHSTIDIESPSIIYLCCVLSRMCEIMLLQFNIYLYFNMGVLCWRIFAVGRVDPSNFYSTNPPCDKPVFFYLFFRLLLKCYIIYILSFRNVNT